MRAWQVHRHGEPADALERADVAVPEPGPGELRVRVAGAGLALPDVFMCRGTYAYSPTMPFTPGQEVVGVVTAAGDGAVTPVGARVMGVTQFVTGHGGFADEALIRDGGAHPAPAEMSDADAGAFMIAFHTAWIGLVRRGTLRKGETLLVLGAAGGTGSAAVQLGKALGARVLAAARGAGKAEACRRLGADDVIDTEGAVHIGEAARAATDGRGVDVVYDPVGGDALAQACTGMANEGRVLLIGFASGGASPLATGDILRRNYSVVGVFAGAYTRPDWEHAHAELLGLYASGALRPMVGTVPFDDLPRGLTEIAERRVVGRLVLAP